MLCDIIGYAKNISMIIVYSTRPSMTVAELRIPLQTQSDGRQTDPRWRVLRPRAVRSAYRPGSDVVGPHRYQSVYRGFIRAPAVNLTPAQKQGSADTDSMTPDIVDAGTYDEALERTFMALISMSNFIKGPRPVVPPSLQSELLLP
jgi:hypothetical protein